MHQEGVPRKGDCTHKPREEEGEAKDTQRIEERMAEVTPEGDINSKTKTGINMKALIRRESRQDLVGPLDQQATRGETMR